MYRFEKLKLAIRCGSTNLRRQKSHDSRVPRMKLDKILIANRGEIACRIVKTAKQLGIRTVAVYSEIDRDSIHVEQADEAHFIGPASSTESYLRQDKIISVARRSKCQAIHPGYGFLSENAEFAELCHKENIVFVGPPAGAIRDMGIKNASKEIMTKAGVPVIPGYHGEDQSNEILLRHAKEIGFPLMIKAIRGGGGKGMRIVSKEADFMEALNSARTESQKAFGDSAVLLEMYIDKPRHIEVQIFADKHENVVHLFERDCSVQRRHQKVIEEAPAPGISLELRENLGAAAVLAARAVGYVGAGTVEFIMNRVNGSFHFMEMNTRLQVEHPVTEAITGLDLVEWQLRVAAGDKLPLKQEEIRLCGHAFEARIYAENPRNGFLPGAGPLSYLRTPDEDAGTVRVETGVRENDQVSVYYDPMIAKLVVWGKNRDESLAVLRSKLCEYNIAGIDTNIEFIKDLCSCPNFQDGLVHTGFIDENYQALFPELRVPSDVTVQATIASILLEDIYSLRTSFKTNDPFSPFATEIGLRLNNSLIRTFLFNVGSEEIEVDVKYVEPEIYSLRINKIGPWRRTTGSIKKLKDGSLELHTEIDGVITRTRLTKIKNKLYLFTKDREWQFIVPPARFVSRLETDKFQANACTALSPMPGSVEKLFVVKGDSVKAGDPLLVINAMKMEHIVRIPIDGIVEDVFCSVGDNVSKGKLLVKLLDDTS